MPVAKQEVDSSPNCVEKNWALVMIHATELEADNSDEQETRKAEENGEETKLVDDKNKGSINLHEQEEENEEHLMDKQQQHGLVYRKPEKRVKIKQNETQNEKEQSNFEHVNIFKYSEYGLQKQLKAREDENYDIKEIKDIKTDSLQGQHPSEVAQQYNGRAILLSPESIVHYCDQRELGIGIHCMSETHKCNVSDEWDIETIGTGEICNIMTDESVTEMDDEVHALPRNWKAHEYRVIPIDKEELLPTLIAKSEVTLNDTCKKQAKAADKVLGVGIVKQVDDELETYELPLEECGEDIIEIPLSRKGSNVERRNIHVDRVDTDMHIGPKFEFECKNQQVGAKMMVTRLVNEEKTIIDDTDTKDNEKKTMLDLIVREESQDKMDRMMISELPKFNGDKEDNVQNVYLNLLEVERVINWEHMGKCGEISRNVSQGCTRSSAGILKSSDDLIDHDFGIFKSVDMVREANLEAKDLEIDQMENEQPQQNINKANVSLGSMSLGIDEKAIAGIKWNEDNAVLTRNNSELDAHELLDAPFVEEKQPLNKVSAFGFQRKEIIENSGDKYESTGDRESLSEINFQSWSQQPANIVVDASLNWSRLEDDETGVKEKEGLHSKQTALVPSNNKLAPCPSPYAGLRSSAPAFQHTSCMLQYPLPNNYHLRLPQTSSSSMNQNDEVNETNETCEKIKALKVKFLRLAHRLGQTPYNFEVVQVLYRLELAEHLWQSRSSSRLGTLRYRAISIAEQKEASGQEDLDFTCTILVLGKTGVGKSATINSIFDEVKSETDAFGIGTKRVQEITGTVNGIRLRVIDTPGLHISFSDQCQNGKILASIKRFIKNRPPDVVLYIDRLDMEGKDDGDLPLLGSLTDAFGSAVWLNSILVLTHASAAPPEGPSGGPISYETFISQRSHLVQQAIRQAAGDMWLMNPVSLVENHPACRTNRSCQRILPNGRVWQTEFLMLCFASQILAEANSHLKLQDAMYKKPMGRWEGESQLHLFLSSLLQRRSQLKLPGEQFGDEYADEDFEDSSDLEEEYEYDKLPPFRRLTRSELAKLDREQKKAYFDELDYREKLFMKKQWIEERRQRRSVKKMTSKEEIEGNMHLKEEDGTVASIPILMPDMALPSSFDADNPAYRYRILDMVSQWLVRPILDSQGWDHDIGYEGLNLEKTFVIGSNIPVLVSAQVIKDKASADLQLECSASLKHREGKRTVARLDIQTIGKEASYTLHSETKFSNFKYNKTTAGLAFTLLGNSLSAGMKVEDVLMIGKRFKVVLNGGAMSDRGNISYGGSLEATLRNKDYPIGGSLATLGCSMMNWHGDCNIGLDLKSQFDIGKNTTIVACANLSSKNKGQVSIRITSLELLQLALLGVIPIAKALICHRLLGSSHTFQ